MFVEALKRRIRHDFRRTKFVAGKVAGQLIDVVKLGKRQAAD